MKITKKMLTIGLIGLMLVSVFPLNVSAEDVVAPEDGVTIVTEEIGEEPVTEEEMLEEEPVLEEPLLVDEEEAAVEPALQAITPMSVMIGANVTVETVADLIDTVNNAEMDKVITLGESFPTTLSDVITLAPNHDFNITIDGSRASGKITIMPATNKRHISVTSTKAGIITFKSINFQGLTSIGGGGVSVSNNTTGSYVFDDVTFRQIVNAGGIYQGSGSTVTVNNCIFENNTSSGGGAAINSENSPKNLTVTNSSFENNVNKGSGYYGGAIFLKNLSGTFSVQNTSFIANTNNTGRGGAIAVHLPTATAVININSSYFEANKALGAFNQSDGGAIALFDILAGAKFSVNNSTFYNNLAEDDGGAMLLQGKDNVNIEINNSTFYQNKAYGKGNDAGQSGGAIQIFANGALLTTTTVKFNQNTFTENASYTFSSSYPQQGGAISSSGNAARTAVSVLTNNIIIGNHVYAVDGTENLTTNYKNISGTITNNGGNIGVDNGTALTVTPEAVFGPFPTSLIINKSFAQAGSPNSSQYRTIPTVPITPIDGLGYGAAQNIGVASALSADERGYGRGTTYDSGAVEIGSITYNSNTGIFSDLPVLTTYNGEVFYTATPEGEATVISDVGTIGESRTIRDGADLTLTGKVFTGWNTQADGTGTEYGVGDAVTLTDGLTLYAQWSTANVTVTYNGNGATTGLPPTAATVPLGDYTLEDQGTLGQEHFSFAGWNTTADGTGTTYQSGDTITLTGDITLYAMWSANQYNLSYNGNGATGGAVPVDSETYTAGSDAIVQTENTLVKDENNFAGWNTAADGTGTTYQSGDVFTLTGDTTLYAMWNIKTYKITYYGNGATEGTAPVDTASYPKGTSVISASQNDLKRSGYSFKEWNTLADGTGVSYSVGDICVIDKDVDLYAIWVQDAPVVVPPREVVPTVTKQNSLPKTGGMLTYIFGGAFFIIGLGLTKKLAKK